MVNVYHCLSIIIRILNVYTKPLQGHAHTSMLALHSLVDSQLCVKNVEKNYKIRKKSKNFKTLYKNLEKYGSFSEFCTSKEKSVMLVTMIRIDYTTHKRNFRTFGRRRLDKALEHICKDTEGREKVVGKQESVAKMAIISA